MSRKYINIFIICNMNKFILFIAFIIVFKLTFVSCASDCSMNEKNPLSHTHKMDKAEKKMYLTTSYSFKRTKQKKVMQIKLKMMGIHKNILPFCHVI